MVLPGTAGFIISPVTGSMLPKCLPPAVEYPDFASAANPMCKASSRHDYANGVLRAVRPATQIGPEWRAAGSAFVAPLSFGATGGHVRRLFDTVGSREYEGSVPVSNHSAALARRGPV